MSGVLADRLQIWGFLEDTVIYTDGSLGGVFKAYPVDDEYCVDAEINSLTEQSRNFLNSISESIDIQFMKEIVQTPCVALRKDTAPAQETLWSTLSHQRHAMFSTMNQEGTLPEYVLWITIRKPLSKPIIKKPKLFGRSKNFSKISEDQLQLEYHAFQKEAGSIEKGLASLGLVVTRASEKQITEKIYNIWNPERAIPLGPYNSDDLRNSLTFTDAAIHPKGFCLGETDTRVISLKLLPEVTHAGMAHILNDLPFGSQIYLSIHVPEQGNELASLQTQRRLAFSLVNGRPGQVRDIDSEAKLQDLESIIEDLVQGGEKLFRFSFNIVLRGPDTQAVDNQVAQCLAKIREMSGAEAMVESVAAFDVYSEFVFPHGRGHERQKRLKTSNLADFLPIHGSWRGHESQASLFRSRNGSLISFDPFASELTNANQIISGASGSGKSYLTNSLLLQFLKDDPKIFIIDIGGSYKKLSESLDGQYIPLGVGSGLSLNPFDLPEGEYRPNEQKIKFLVGLIETMTKENDSTGLARLERAELEEAIINLYDKISAPRLMDLRQALLVHNNPRMQIIGKILSQWTGNTPFGQFLDRPTNISLEKKMICFDLKGLESHEDLQAACLFVITDLIWRSVQLDKTSKKYLIFDECWRILETPAGAALVGDVFRTFRKYFASAIAISQTIDDFARSSVGHAIIPNASVKWLMKQRGANKENFKKVLGLNDHELNVVESLRQERGEFSEGFLMAGDRRAVVRVESTPYEYWIATTDPRDLAAIELAQKEHEHDSLAKILLDLSTQHPRGMAARKGLKS